MATSESRFLKTVLFGGYERAGVEKRFEYLTAQLFSLKNELRENKLLLAELRKGTDAETAAEGILAGERAKLTQVQVQHESASKRLKVVEDDLKERDAEVEALKQELAALRAEMEDKNQRLAALESNNDAVALSTVFIEAQKSAKLLVDNAKKEAEDLDVNSRKLAENIVADANNSAKKIIYDAEVQSAETLADAENRSAQMEAASENLRATVLKDVTELNAQVSSLQSVLGQFRDHGLASLEKSAKLLKDADAKLKAGGVPVFRATEQVMPKYPDEPEYENVDHSYNGASEEKSEAAKKNDEALAKLRQMADSISSKKKPETKEADSSNAGSNSNGGGMDLAALAAQAAALKKGK